MSKVTDAMRLTRRGFCSCVVAAAGSSERMGEDKLFHTLDGVPVLAMTLLALQRSGSVDEIVVSARAERLEEIGLLRERYGIGKLTRVVLGGESRTESVLHGVMAVSKKAKIVCIHDGARPFVTEEVIADAVQQAALNAAAAPAVPLKDTVKRAQAGVVLETPERSALWAVQTPQAFRAEIIRAALDQAARSGRVYSDDCAAAEAIGCRVKLSKGDEDNIKLTTPADLELAEAILHRRRGAEA